jgi:ParB family chromosome partitioning protein
MSLKKSKGINNLVSQFTKEETTGTETLAISQLMPFENHPFKLYEGKRLDDMVRSIKELGILVPIIVRPKGDNQYEILSGHNRVNAAELAGLDSVPVVIKENLSDKEAMLIVTETNLVQRSFTDLSHSEKAIALKTHMEAIKAQGKRTDIIKEINSLITSNLTDKKLLSVEKTGLQYGLSSASVARYIRVSYLIKSLQNRVDKDEIGLYPAVSLSYLKEDEQTALNLILEIKSYKIDMKKAGALRDLSAEKNFTGETVTAVLSGKLNNKSDDKAPLKIKHEVYSMYFTKGETQEEMEKIIEKALTEYFNNHKEEVTK